MFLKILITFSNHIIVLSSNKIQNGDILLPANPGPPGKMAIKTERNRCVAEKP